MSFDLDFTGAWAELGTVLHVSRAEIKKAADLSARDVSDEFLRMVKEGIESQAPGGLTFEPLKPSTLDRRKRGRRGLGPVLGTKALIARRDLINGLRVTKYGDEYFVGIPDDIKGQEGQRLAVIAKVHEFGATVVQSTPTGVRIIHIPARPFILPVMEQMASDPARVTARAREHLARALGML